MNANILIGPALGMIPEIGPILSGAYESHEKEKFNHHLFESLNAIETKLDEVENLIKEAITQEELNAIAFATNNAQGTINGWWKGRGGVKNWLESNEQLDSGTSHKICNNIGTLLDCIHNAITQENIGEKTWVQVYVDYFIQQNSSNRTVSYLESTYKAFLGLVHLQLRGVMCARAAGYKDADLIALDTLNNIITQGIYVQNNVINPYLDPSHADHETFCWFLQNTTSSMEIKIEDQIHLALDTQSCTAGMVSGGIEFTPGPSPSSQFGLRIASSKMDKYGDLIPGGSWNALAQSANNSFNLENGDRGNVIGARIQWYTNNIVLPPSQFITGVALNANSNIGPDGGGLRQYNQLYMTVDSGTMNPDGTINSCPTITQDTSGNPQGLVNLMAEYQLAHINSTSFQTTSTSPITGIGMCQAPCLEGGVMLQTSIHAHAFAPIPIIGSKHVAIGNRRSGMGLSNGSDPIAQQNLGSGSQAMILQNLSGNAEYGSIIQIVSASDQSSKLTVTNPSKGEVNFSSTSPANPNTAVWVLRDPRNFQYTLPGGTRVHGTSPISNSIYNWNCVILQSAYDETQCLYITSNNKLKIMDTTSIMKIRKQQQLIGDSRFTWNLSQL